VNWFWDSNQFPEGSAYFSSINWILVVS